MEDLTFREAAVADLEVIRGLYGQFEGWDELTPGKAAEIFSRIERYPDYKIYLALVGGQPVGTFALLVMDNLGHGGAPSGIVENVIVDRTWRSRGIGAQMMRFALGQCKRRGCYKLVLSSNVRNTQAHRFYEALGFVKHGYSFKIELE